MESRPPAPQVSARIGALVVQTAAANGVDANALMASVGVDASLLSDPDARIALALEERLWDRAAALTGDEGFGLHAAERLRPGAFDVLDYAVRTAPDLRAALERLARYNRLMHDLAQFALIPVDGGLRLEHRFGAPGLSPCRQASEFTLAALVVVAGQMSGQPVLPRAVEFAHPAPATTEPHRRLFGREPRFAAPVSALTLDDEVLQRPVPTADPGLSRIVTQHAERWLAEHPAAPESLIARIRRLLGESMAEGPLSLRDVAQCLQLSERSLQRRLEAEGARFAELAEAVRRDLAFRYVADPRLALGEAAYLLGFSEPSAFHRAFKRWSGTTPAAARRAARDAKLQEHHD